MARRPTIIDQTKGSWPCLPYLSPITDKMGEDGRSDTKKKCTSAYECDRSSFSCVATSIGHDIVTIEIYSGVRFMRTREWKDNGLFGSGARRISSRRITAGSSPQGVAIECFVPLSLGYGRWQ